MAKKLLIFPFGGNARESLLSIFAINNLKKKWDIIGFIDDDKTKWGKVCCGVKVVGGKDLLKKFQDAELIAVPGSPGNYIKRKDVIESLGVKSSRFAQIIHPSVVVSLDARIGYNTFIMPNVVVGSGVKIGNHCVILANTVLGHDTVIRDYCCIGSNVAIAGNVSIGQTCYIGSGSSIRDNIAVGAKTLVGLGSNVVCNIKESVIAAGNPARVIRKAD